MPRDVTTASPPARAAYLHVPFCRHHCGYCNFTVIAGRDDLIERYLRGMELELESLQVARPVDSLFIGGGTPTHLAPGQLERLLELARRWFDLQPGAEFSIEANPVDIRPDRVEILARQGVTRVSLGVQSFDAGKLSLLERDHRAPQVVEAVELLRDRIESISLDLIFGVPGETLADWSRDLDQALRLAPQHVSTYGLTIERGSAFFGRALHGQFEKVDEDLESAMYGQAIDRLTQADWEHYEVSNFARPGRRCRQHEAYWSGAGYFAAGPGASRYVNGCRQTNHRSTLTWLKRVESRQSPVESEERLSSEDRAREALVLGLRRLRGLESSEFQRDFGFSPQELFGAELEPLLTAGLLRTDGQRLQLTRAGLFVSDSIWPLVLRG